MFEIRLYSIDSNVTKMSYFYQIKLILAKKVPLFCLATETVSFVYHQSSELLTSVLTFFGVIKKRIEYCELFDAILLYFNYHSRKVIVNKRSQKGAVSQKLVGNRSNDCCPGDNQRRLVFYPTDNDSGHPFRHLFDIDIRSIRNADCVDRSPNKWHPTRSRRSLKP